MPPFPKPKSQAQRGAMQAAAVGKSTLGIPPKVGKEFAAGDPGGALPARTTTGAAADKTVREMVKESKSGKGTLTYTPTAKKPPPRKKISRLPSY